ncbi:hypothetical protein TRAPUB_5297 [Trametes pubescens]|uniref:Uncharacterized protein n=1 Tax=Trametes pubescens TaxID=154538 RepID=A0A1M2V8M1_TRAPU|nr:hypothetical protein TRAPUB_5297 [Trametes pubescens]
MSDSGRARHAIIDDASISKTALADSFALGGMANCLASINTLPDELLVHILLLTRLSPPLWRTKKINPTRYMQVCQRWRAVILAHGTFWDTITIHKRTEWFLLSLSRSHQVPLHLTFADLPTLASVLPHVLPLRDRIQSLVLGRGSREELVALSSLIDGVFPSLTKLSITNGGIPSPLLTPAVDQLLFLPTNYPRLAHLELERLPVTLTDSLFRHLTTLTLKSCSPGPSQLTADAFLDMLESAERLENLTLNRYLSTACAHLPSPSRHSFSLPRLRNLDLTDTAAWVRQLTTFVQLPPSGSVRLVGSLGHTELDTARTQHWTLLLPHLPGLPFLLTPTSLSLSEYLGQAVLHSTGGPVDASLTLMPADFTDWEHKLIPSATMLTAAAGLFTASALAELTLSIDLQDVPRAVFDAFFDALPHLASLRVTPHMLLTQDEHPLTPHLLESLSLSLAASSLGDLDSSSDRVPARCPRLARLTLAGFSWDGGAVMGALVACLRARAALGATPLQRLGVAVKPRRRGAGWKDARYAAQLRKMVEREYRFEVRADAAFFF